MAKKKTPVDAFILAEEAFTGAQEAVCFGDRIARYTGAKKHALGMLEHLQGAPEDPAAAAIAAARLGSCGNWLHFRDYYTVDKIRLHAAQFCKQHLICPLCAIRRGAKTLAAYLSRWQVIHEASPHLQLYLITFTVKNGPELAERQAHLVRGLKRLLARRRDFNAGTARAPWTEMCKVEGGVYTQEVTNIGNGWHPHAHMLAACTSAPDASALATEWQAITGDSFVVDVRPITGDPVDGFLEVFKYAVKFADLDYAQNWHAAQVLKGKRLLASFGAFWGVKVPEEMTDEPLDGLPFVDRFYRFLQGAYQFTGESPREAPQDAQEGPRSIEAVPDDQRQFPKPAEGDGCKAIARGSVQSAPSPSAGDHDQDNQEQPMQKPKPIITEQSREEIHKVSDLIEVAGSRPAVARWRVSGIDYEWAKGSPFVLVNERLSWRRMPLVEPTKTAAKRAVFLNIRNS
ncbi:Replication protein [compost metagenome]